MQYRSFFALVAMAALACTFVDPLLAGKKKKKDEEPVTQTLPVLKDPPQAILADTDHLSFRVAPLSAKGLLSAQVRESLKFLLKENKGTIVKLRAFVAGTGDMRRFGTIVSEMFSDKKLPLPAITTVQAGGLPLDGAQVVIEAISVEKKSVNPQGVALVAALPLEQVEAALKSLGLGGGRVLRATCYVPSLDNHQQSRAAVTAAFPNASVNLIQMQRMPVRGSMICETVAALERAPSGAVEFRDNSHVALLGPGKIVITGTQLAFHAQDADVRLAFERLGRTLEGMQTSYSKVVAVWFYPLADDVAEKIRERQKDFLPKDHPPVVSSILMEGLPSLDASFAAEVIAIP